MALITENLEIPDIGRLFPSTRRRHVVKPCGSAAAYRRHFRRREPVDRACADWHMEDMQARRARKKAERNG